MPKLTAGVTMSLRSAPESMPPGSNSWDVVLRFQGRRMTVPFHTGPAIEREPSAADVLECLASDASSADQTFGDWCGDYGYDTDSRKAYATYQAVQAQTTKLRRLLGEFFDDTVQRSEFRAAGDGSVFL